MRPRCLRWVTALLLMLGTADAMAADIPCDKNHYILDWNCADAKAAPANHLVGLGDDCTLGVALCFYPDRLTIKVGDSVTFFPYDSNDFNGPRNVVADDGSFRCASGCDGEGGDGTPKARNWQFTRTFNALGEVAYHDEVSHASGVIEVLPNDGTGRPPVAIEYMYRSGDFRYVSSFFLTWFPEEIAALDVGGIWWRTGESFEIWNAPAAGTLPACRFMDKTFGGHFYTPYDAECTGLKANEGWQFEGTAFHLQIPDANGNCPPSTTILYRLYNDSRIHPVQPFQGTFYTHAPLHRYTTRVELFDRMRGEGWLFEGDTRTFAFACVPSGAAASMQ